MASGTSSDIASSQLSECLDPRGARARWKRRGRMLWGPRSELLPRSVELFFRDRGRIQTVVSDLVKAVGQDMLEEAAQEFHVRERGDLAILGAERNGSVGDVYETAIGDGYSMSVPAEVAEHVADFSEWLLRVNDPGLLGSTAHEPREGFWVLEVVETDEVALGVERGERGEHFGPENEGHRLHGEEIGLARRSPFGLVYGEAARRDEAMDVG
jgi:hypothetical protein